MIPFPLSPPGVSAAPMAKGGSFEPLPSPIGVVLPPPSPSRARVQAALGPLPTLLPVVAHKVSTGGMRPPAEDPNGFYQAPPYSPSWPTR
jgi:hypothetical protein